jgi:hypothetical protein
MPPIIIRCRFTTAYSRKLDFLAPDRDIRGMKSGKNLENSRINNLILKYKIKIKLI